MAKLKNLEKLDILKKTEEHDSTIVEFMTDSNESSKTEIKSKDIFKMPKKTENIKVGKFEDFEYFILTEIEKAVKNLEQNSIQKYQELIEDGIDNTSKETVNSNKVILNVSSQNHSEADELKSRIKYHIEFMRKKELSKEFKNRIWVTEKEKNKHSIHSKQKTETSTSDYTPAKKSKSRDSQKYVIKVEGKKVDVQEHVGKHIDDEL